MIVALSITLLTKVWVKRQQVLWCIMSSEEPSVQLHAEDCMHTPFCMMLVWHQAACMHYGTAQSHLPMLYPDKHLKPCQY